MKVLLVTLPGLPIELPADVETPTLSHLGQAAQWFPLDGPSEKDRGLYWWSLLTGRDPEKLGRELDRTLSTCLAPVKTFVDLATDHAKRCLVGEELSHWPRLRHDVPSSPPAGAQEDPIARLQRRLRWLNDAWDGSFDLVWFHDDGLEELLADRSSPTDSRIVISNYLQTLDRGLERSFTRLNEEWGVAVVSPYGFPEFQQGHALLAGEGVCSDSAARANLVDLAPTFLVWLGVKPPDSLDGRSLVTAGTAPNDQMSEEELLRERLRGLGYVE